MSAAGTYSIGISVLSILLGKWHHPLWSKKDAVMVQLLSAGVLRVATECHNGVGWGDEGPKSLQFADWISQYYKHYLIGRGRARELS